MSRTIARTEGGFSAEKSIQLQHIALGVCYYPEQWPREMWQSDLRRMKVHGIETVRIR